MWWEEKEPVRFPLIVFQSCTCIPYNLIQICLSWRHADSQTSVLHTYTFISLQLCITLLSSCVLIARNQFQLKMQHLLMTQNQEHRKRFKIFDKKY